MNLAKLKQAEQEFFKLHPEGFEDPSMQQIMKRHKMESLIEFAQLSFTPDCASHVEQTVANMVKLINRSSMVSMFEKPKFRDFVGRLNKPQKDYLVDALVELLHGNQQSGFEAFADLLMTEKIAKWTLITAFPTYFCPHKEVFIKPTTAKGIINYFEVENLVYTPKANWAFYKGYRILINQTKKKVDSRLSPSNAAFTGFLMMSL